MNLRVSPNIEMLQGTPEDATAEPTPPVANDANATPILDQREASPWGTNASTASESPSNSPRWFLSTSLRELLHGPRPGFARAKSLALVCPALTKAARPALRDQLERAASSIALTLAEGCARRTRRDRHHFFSIAQGSAMECAAAIDILRVLGHATLTDAARAKHKLTRIVQMLVARGQAFASPRGSSALGLRRSR